MENKDIINEVYDKIIKVYYGRDDKAAINHFRSDLIKRFALEKEGVENE